MRAREGLPDQLTAACFQPSALVLAPKPPRGLALCSRPRQPDESSCSNAGGETAIKLARATDLLFRLLSGFPSPAFCAVSRRKRNCRKRPSPQPPRPPPPFNLEKFQRVQISGALEHTDWPQYTGARRRRIDLLSRSR